MKAAAPAADVVMPDANARDAAALDEGAFHALYRRTAGPLRAYAARVLGDVTRADDIVQESFLRILRRPLPTDDPQELRAYLFRIASNLMADAFRRDKREVPLASVPERSAPGRDAALRLDLQQLFQRISPRDRALIWLAHVEEASHAEIARALSVRERSVRVLLSRARRRLADLMRQTGRWSVGR